MSSFRSVTVGIFSGILSGVSLTVQGASRWLLLWFGTLKINRNLIKCYQCVCGTEDTRFIQLTDNYVAVCFRPCYGVMPESCTACMQWPINTILSSFLLNCASGSRWMLSWLIRILQKEQLLISWGVCLVKKLLFCFPVIWSVFDLLRCPLSSPSVSDVCLIKSTEALLILVLLM